MKISYSNPARDAGQIIRQIRKSRNLRLEDIARATGITKATLSKLENGRNVNTSTLYTVAEYLRIDIFMVDGQG